MLSKNERNSPMILRARFWPELFCGKKFTNDIARQILAWIILWNHEDLNLGDVAQLWQLVCLRKSRLDQIQILQECIPVGCVPSTAVGGCLPREVCLGSVFLGGICLGGVCSGVCVWLRWCLPMRVPRGGSAKGESLPRGSAWGVSAQTPLLWTES